MNYLKLTSVLGLMLAMSGCAKDGQMTPPPSASSLQPIDEPSITVQTRLAAGQLAESRGDFKAALQQYNEALALAPKSQAALYRIGCIDAQEKNFKDSIATWKKYLDVTNNCATGYANLAFTEELAGNPAGAEADYKHGIAREPSNAPCRVNYGLMLARNNRIGDAIIQLQAVLSPAEVHYNLASVYQMQHSPEKAKLEYRQAVALDPNFTDARSRLTDLGSLIPEGASDKADMAPEADDLNLDPPTPSDTEQPEQPAQPADENKD